MKTPVSVLAIVLTLLVSTLVEARPPWGDPRFGPGQYIDRRVELMADRLDLAPEQQEQIRSILESHQAKRKADLAALREQVDAVLSAEQRAARNEAMTDRLERRLDRLAARLELSPEQEAELRSLAAEKRRSGDWNPGDFRNDLSAVLTESQLAKLQAVRSKPGYGPRGGCRQ